MQRRIAQSLRNQLLRLRHRYVNQFDDREGLHATLSALARPLAIELAALLQVGGHALPPEDRTAAIYAAATQALGLNGQTLAELAALRNGEASVDVAALFERLLPLLSALADRVDTLASAA